MTNAGKYQLPAELNGQLKRLFGEIVFHDFIYGADGVPNEWKSKDLPPSFPIQTRGRYLIEWIESYLKLKVEEFDEYDDPEQTARLRAEATGMLIAMRETLRHIPELLEPVPRRKI
jgi:hypothetical protein